jgi:hypothetical protein
LSDPERCSRPFGAAALGLVMAGIVAFVDLVGCATGARGDR